MPNTDIDVDGLAQAKTALLKIHQKLLAVDASEHRMLDASEFNGWGDAVLSAALMLDRAGRALQPTDAGVGEPVWDDAAKIADKVADEYTGAEEGTFRAGVYRAAIMIARRIRSKQIPYYGSALASPTVAREAVLPSDVPQRVSDILVMASRPAALVTTQDVWDAVREALLNPTPPKVTP